MASFLVELDDSYTLEVMQNGYTDLPPGKLANVVTYLEMRSPKPIDDGLAVSDYAIRRVEDPDLDWYRRLYREIGEQWLWFSRLRMTDEELRAILHDPTTDVLALSEDGQDAGLLEFDRRGFPDIEVTFLGVKPAFIGKGAGRTLAGARTEDGLATRPPACLAAYLYLGPSSSVGVLYEIRFCSV